MISHGRDCPASFTRSRLRRTASLGISAGRPALLRTASPGAGKHRSGGRPQPGKTFCCGGACLASIGVRPGPQTDQAGPRQIKTDRMLSHVRACARAPLSRARIPRFPAAARRAVAGARGVRVLSRRRVVRGAVRDRIDRRAVLRAGRADRAVADFHAGRRRGRGPDAAAAGHRRREHHDRGRRGNLRAAGAGRPPAAVADDPAGGADRDRHGAVLPGVAGAAAQGGSGRRSCSRPARSAGWR